jgi:SAM-dependent methyltransferase
VSSREALSRYLVGSGIEVGPGHAPLAVPAGVDVRYVDRLTPAEHHFWFPELSGDDGFLEPDVIADLDTDGLKAIDTQSQDFVICSHVLEHLADPLRFIDEAHRVLRVGGDFLILLPDRRYTFDRNREPTPLSCLIRDHEVGATTPDDVHMKEFLLGADQGPAFVLPDDPRERGELYEWHRNRSIHVHCWTEDEFPEVLRHCSEQLGHSWELVDQLDRREPEMEFGYVLARARDYQPRRFAKQLNGAMRGSDVSRTRIPRFVARAVRRGQAPRRSEARHARPEH